MDFDNIISPYKTSKACLPLNCRSDDVPKSLVEAHDKVLSLQRQKVAQPINVQMEVLQDGGREIWWTLIVVVCACSRWILPVVAPSEAEFARRCRRCRWSHRSCLKWDWSHLSSLSLSSLPLNSNLSLVAALPHSQSLSLSLKIRLSEPL